MHPQIVFNFRRCFQNISIILQIDNTEYQGNLMNGCALSWLIGDIFVLEREEPNNNFSFQITLSIGISYGLCVRSLQYLPDLTTNTTLPTNNNLSRILVISNILQLLIAKCRP